MSIKEPNAINISTPKGIAIYPNLHKPDTKWKPEGVYQVRLRLPGDVVAGYMEKARQLAEDQLAYAKAKYEARLAEEKDGAKKGKLKKLIAELKTIDLPFKPVYDEAGEETGEYEMTWKMNAQRTDKKTGKVIKMRPNWFDAKGKPTDPIELWSRSEIKVAGKMQGFDNPKGEIGVTLRLAAVKVIKVVAGGTGDADSYGFGEEEEGFEGDPSRSAGFDDDGDDTPPQTQGGDSDDDGDVEF